MIHPRLRRRSVIALVACAALSAAAHAQEVWPSRPITIVVPYPPGGSNDVFARAVGKKLADSLGQPVVIDNRPGAGGSMGAAAVARARADGYTLAAVSSSYTTNAAVQPKMPFDPEKSLVGVAPMARGPFLVAVRSDLSVKTPAELVALAKRNPGNLNYASSGLGSTNQFATELLKIRADVLLTHVPYKGMAPATTDLMSGLVDVLIASSPSLQPALSSGRARAIAVTSPERNSAAPELPPMSQAAPGYEFEVWWGILAPAGLPDVIAQKLNAAVSVAVSSPDMRAFFQREGAEPFVAGYSDFSKQVRNEIVHWKAVARQAGIRAE